MLQISSSVRVYLACQPVDMRLGAPGLCAAVKRLLKADPFQGSLFIFRSRKSNYLKIVYFDGSGICLFSKRMERSRFVFPRTTEGSVQLTSGQLGLLLEGIDWRHTERPAAIPKPELI